MLGRSKFALRQGFRLRQKRLYAPSGAAPSSSQSPLCSVSACGKNFAALPCSSSPQTTHCVGLVWGSPRWGPEKLGDEKSKAARSGGFAEGNNTYFRLKKAFMPGYSAISPSSPSGAAAPLGSPHSNLTCSAEMNSACAKVFAAAKTLVRRSRAAPSAMGPRRSWAKERAGPPYGRPCLRFREITSG